MKRDLTCFDPNCVFFTGCISISFYRLYSKTKLQWTFCLPPFGYFTKVGFSWQSRSGKTLPTCFVLSTRKTKFFDAIFCRGNKSTFALSLAFGAENIKNLSLRLRSREKI